MSVKYLPPSVKQLLTLRHPHLPPAPHYAKLNAVLRTTLEDAERRKAETGWLTLTTCTLLTANLPTSVGQLYHFATRTDPTKADTRISYSDALTKAALMRESAMKSSIFVGVPRTILSLGGLHDALEEDVKAGLRKDSKRTADGQSVGEILSRGKSLWASIYRPHAEKLHDKLAGYHPDFMAFILQSYGSVLAPLPGGASEQGNLSRALGSVVGTACLRAEGGVGPQLISHVFGLLKARDVEGMSEEDYWLASDEGTEWVIRTVDTLLDVIIEEGHPKAKL